MKGDLLMTLIPLGFNGRAVFIMTPGAAERVTHLQIIPSGTGMIELSHGRPGANRADPKHARHGRVVFFKDGAYMVCDEHASPVPIFEVLSSC